MKKYTVFYLILFIPFLCYGQFEQKVTFSCSAGFCSPQALLTGYNSTDPSTKKTFAGYQYTDAYGVKYDRPYIFENFSSGAFFNAGVQYNLNRHLSMGGKIKPLYLFNWDHGKNVYPNIDMTLFNLGLAANTKYRLIPSSKVCPYIYLEGSLNYTTLSFKYNMSGTTFITKPQQQPAFLNSSLGFGVNPAFGLELNLNDHLGLYLQAGYNYIFIDDKNFNAVYYDGHLEQEDFRTIYIEIGLNFSFIKSSNL